MPLITELHTATRTTLLDLGCSSRIRTHTQALTDKLTHTLTNKKTNTCTRALTNAHKHKDKHAHAHTRSRTCSLRQTRAHAPTRTLTNTKQRHRCSALLRTAVHRAHSPTALQARESTPGERPNKTAETASINTTPSTDANHVTAQPIIYRLP